MIAILKWAGLGLLALLVLFVVVGFLLPSDYHIERSVEIEAEPARVHALVGDLQRWPDWTPWQEIDPSIETIYGEVTSGVGAHQSWSGKSGGGKLTFTKCDPETGVAYDMYFDGDDNLVLGEMRYEAAGGGTRVTWTMSGEFGANLIGRYFGLMMGPMIEPMFDDGLAKLKTQVETSVPAAPPADPMEREPGGEAEDEPASAAA